MAAMEIKDFSYAETLHNQILTLESASAELIARIKDKTYTRPADMPRLAECLTRNVITTERLATNLWYHLHPEAPKMKKVDVSATLNDTEEDGE